MVTGVSLAAVTVDWLFGDTPEAAPAAARSSSTSGASSTSAAGNTTADALSTDRPDINSWVRMPATINYTDRGAWTKALAGALSIEAASVEHAALVVHCNDGEPKAKGAFMAALPDGTNLEWDVRGEDVSGYQPFAIDAATICATAASGSVSFGILLQADKK